MYLTAVTCAGSKVIIALQPSVSRTEGKDEPYGSLVGDQLLASTNCPCCAPKIVKNAIKTQFSMRSDTWMLFNVLQYSFDFVTSHALLMLIFCLKKLECHLCSRIHGTYLTRI